MNKKIYRSTNDRMLGGVCGGIAEYFNIDSTIIRLLAVLLFFAEGIGVILYIVSWIIIPEGYYSGEKSFKNNDDTVNVNDYSFESDTNNDSNDNRNFKNSGTTDKNKGFNFEDEWKSNSPQKTLGIILIALGSIFLIDNWFPFFRWERFWPLILVGFGVVFILKGVKNE